MLLKYWPIPFLPHCFVWCIFSWLERMTMCGLALLDLEAPTIFSDSTWGVSSGNVKLTYHAAHGLLSISLSALLLILLLALLLPLTYATFFCFCVLVLYRVFPQ